MSQKITAQTSTSNGIWEGLEALVREHVQQLIQAFWRRKSQRSSGGRNPRGEPRWMRPRGITMGMENPDGWP